MATKVTSAQILSLNPSQLNAQGAIPGDVLVALSSVSNGGLTLTWSPTSVLPRTASHGQVLAYNFYSSQWMASSINVGGGSAIPTGNSNQINQVLTWNGAQWVIAPPQGTVTSVSITNTDGSLSVGPPNIITSTGTIPINLNSVLLSKIERGGAGAGQVITWNPSTLSWAPSAVTNSVGTIRALVVFNGVNMGISLSKNVTSITDHGVGDYTINFATSFGANYAYTFGISKNPSGQFNGTVAEVSRTASSIRVHTGFPFTTTTFNQHDPELVSMVFVN